MPFPKRPSEEIREKISTLSRLAHRLEAEKVYNLKLRLKILKSEALKRSLGWRGVSKEYAENCELCKGSGQFHFCVNPYCDSDQELEKDDCLHFTPHELEGYEAIQEDFTAVMALMLEFLTSDVGSRAVARFLSEDDPIHEEMN